MVNAEAAANCFRCYHCFQYLRITGSFFRKYTIEIEIETFEILQRFYVKFRCQYNVRHWSKNYHGDIPENAEDLMFLFD